MNAQSTPGQSSAAEAKDADAQEEEQVSRRLRRQSQTFDRLMEGAEEGDIEEEVEEELLDPSLQMTEEELLAAAEEQKDKKMGVLAASHGVSDEANMKKRIKQLERLEANQRRVEKPKARVTEMPNYVISGDYTGFDFDEASEQLDEKVLGTISRYSALNGSYDGRHKNEILRHVGNALDRYQEQEAAIRQRRAAGAKPV